MAGGGDGRLGYHTRNDAGLTGAPYLEWANHVVDLPAAFPAFVPQPVQPDPGGWCRAQAAARSGSSPRCRGLLCLGVGGVSAIIRIGRPRRSRRRSLPAATLDARGWPSMLAMSIVWRMQAAEPVTVTPGPDGRAAADRVRPRRGLRSDVALAACAAPRPGRWGSRRRSGAGAWRAARALNRPLATFPLLPAGHLSPVGPAPRRRRRPG